MSTLEEKLKKRKIDALRRGIHRVGEEASLPFNVNLIGIGEAGAGVVAAALKTLSPSEKKLSALVVDMDENGVADVQRAAAEISPERASVDIVEIGRSDIVSLRKTLSGYDGFLRLEYPFFPWRLRSADWLPELMEVGEREAAMRRAQAKALYGRSYYDGGRPLAKALRQFGEKIESVRAQPIVCLIFDLGSPAGSGVVVDLARHLTNVVLGRRALVLGIGILPSSSDEAKQQGGAFFATLNELDCLGDESKNEGVVASCGELFRNPFTGGLLLVPQEQAYRALGAVEDTRRRVNDEIASLVTAHDGANLWEMLRMLNWVAAPSTQHSAARTPWGAKWIHIFGFADVQGPIKIGPDFRNTIGIRETYEPEFMELRVADGTSQEATFIANQLQEVFSPSVPPQIAGGGREGSVQFVLPSVSKLDLRAFWEAKDAYQSEPDNERILDHSLLLEQGIVLSEPSARLEGMAGRSLDGWDSWISVSLRDLLGEPVLEEQLRVSAK